MGQTSGKGNMIEIENNQIKMDYVLSPKGKSNFGEIIAFETLKELNKEGLAGKQILINEVEAMKENEIKELVNVLVSTEAQVYVLTKSSDITNNLELFKQIPNVVVGVSAGSENDKLLAFTEEGSSTYRERMNTLEMVAGENIKNVLHIAPIYPFVGDYESIIRQMHGKVDHIYLENLKPSIEEVPQLVETIGKHFPELKGAYEKIFNDDHYFEIFWDAEAANIRQIAKELNIEEKIHFDFKR